LISALALALGGLTQPQAWADDPPDPGVAPDLTTRAQPFVDAAAGITLAETTPAGTLWTVEYPGGSALTAAAHEDGQADKFRLTLEVADSDHVTPGWSAYNDSAGLTAAFNGGWSGVDADTLTSQYQISASPTGSLWFKASLFAFGAASGADGPLLPPAGAAAGELSIARGEPDAYGGLNQVAVGAPAAAEGYLWVGFQFQNLSTGQWSILTAGSFDSESGRWSVLRQPDRADSLWRAVYASYTVADEPIQPALAATGSFTAQVSTDYVHRVKLTAPAPVDGYRFVQFEQSLDGQVWSSLPCLIVSGSSACHLTEQLSGGFTLDNVPLPQSTAFRAVYFGAATADPGIYPAEAATGSVAVQSSPNYPTRLMLTAPAPEPGWRFGQFEYESAPGGWTAVTSNGRAAQQADGSMMSEQVTPAASARYRARYFRADVRSDSSAALQAGQGASGGAVILTVTLPAGHAIGKIEYTYVNPTTGQSATVATSRTATAVADQPGVYQVSASGLALPMADLEFSVSLIEVGLAPVAVSPAAAGSGAWATANPANPFQFLVGMDPDFEPGYVMAAWFCEVRTAEGWQACAGALNLRVTNPAAFAINNSSDQGKDIRFQARFTAFSAGEQQPGGTFTVTRTSDTALSLAVTSLVDDGTEVYSLTRWEQSTDGGMTWSTLSGATLNRNLSPTVDTVYRAVFGQLTDPQRLTAVQDLARGAISIKRNGTTGAALSVDSVRSEADGAWTHGFVRWQHTTATDPQETDWSDVTGSAGTTVTAAAVTYTGDTSYRAVFARVGVEVASGSVGLGQASATVNPTNLKSVTIQATPAAGQLFDRWESSTDAGQTWSEVRARISVPEFGGYQSEWLAPATYTFTVAQDVVYRAHFIDLDQPAALTVQQTAGGTVELTRLNGEAYTLWAQPEPGYVNVGWQSRPVDQLVWQQAIWSNSASGPDYVIGVKAGEQPMVYRARFVKADGVTVTFKAAPEAKGGLLIRWAYYLAQISGTGAAAANVNVLSGTGGATTLDGASPDLSHRFMHGNLADQTMSLPADVAISVTVHANGTRADLLANYFDAANFSFVGFRVNGELVPVADFDTEREDGADNLLGSLDGGRLTYLLSRETTFGYWNFTVTNTDATGYARPDSNALPSIPAGTPLTAFAGDLVIEPVYAHRGDAETVSQLDLADVGAARLAVESVAAWVAPQARGLSAAELSDWLTTEVARLQLSGTLAEVAVTDYEPAQWGEDGADGVDGAFEFSLTLTKGETVDTMTGLSGRIAWQVQPAASTQYRLNALANDPARGQVAAEPVGGDRWRLTAQPGDGWILAGWEYSASAAPAPDAAWTTLPDSLDLRLQMVEVDFDVTYRAIFDPAVVTLAGDDVRVVRAVDGVSVSGGPFVVGGGAGTSCQSANANYLSGHALPMIEIEQHYYLPGVSQLNGCAAGPDTVSAFDNVVLWFPISHDTPVTGAVTVQVFGGEDQDQLLGSLDWTDLLRTTGVVVLPVDSLPPGDQVKVSLQVAEQPAVERVYPLSDPPSQAKGLLEERAAAIAQLRSIYQEGLARNAVGTSATGQYYSSRYLMLSEEYPHAVTAIAEVEGAEALAQAVAHWTGVLDDAGHNIFTTGVSLNAGGSVVTVPASANILMAVTAAAEQIRPGQWRLSTGYNGAWINGWLTGGWGQITNEGQQGSATYVVYDRACVEASSGQGGLGHFGDACPYTNGVAAQRVYLTAQPSDGLFSTFGRGDNVVTMSWDDPDPDAAWPGRIFAWPGTMGWALGDLRQAFDDADLATHEAYAYAIAHQSPLAEEYDRTFEDLKVEFLDFLFRTDPDMTEAAKTVVRAIAGLGTQSTQADREAILAAYDAMTTPEKQAVFNYDVLASWPPRGTGFVEVTLTVTGSAAHLVPDTTGVQVGFAHQAFGSEPARSGVLRPLSDGAVDRTGLLPVGAEVSFTVGAPPEVPGVVWGQPSLSVQSLTVAEGQVHSLTLSLRADRVTLPDAAPEALSLAAAWLGRQLATHDGVLPGMSPQDWGLTEDAILALAAAGLGGDQIEASVARLLASGQTYIGAPGAAGMAWNAKGKTILVLQVTGHDPTVWPVAGGGSRDLVAELRAAIQPSGQFGAQAPGDVFAYQQALSLVALARTPDGAPSASVAYLQSLQCRSAGTAFGAYGSGTTCDRPDADGTALAVQALVAAGLAPSDPSIADAVAWLESQQNAAGAFGGNTNSTGLAAQALRAAGLSEDQVLSQAASYNASLQVTCAVLADDPGELTLADLGAVAYDAAGWAEGVEYGLDDVNSDQWRRASAQALFAFDGAWLGTLTAAGAEADLPLANCQEPTTEPTEDPTTEPTEEPTEDPTTEPTEEPTTEPTTNLSQVTVSSDLGSLMAGARLAFSAAGFTPGELVQASLGSTSLGLRTADSAGLVSFDWTVPEGTAAGQQLVVALVGLTSGHQASGVFQVTAGLPQSGSSATLLALLALVSACFLIGGGSLVLTSAPSRRGGLRAA
jgi:hypothetical protein